MALGPAVIFPLGGPGNVRGVLTVGRHPGSMPLTHAAIEMVGSFAAQAAIALELADARRDAEQVTVLQDRERIARDLHDLVIQRLYATGMSLQGAMPLIARPEVADRVSRAVDALDDTIGDIRSAIFALQARHDVKQTGIRERILAIMDEMTGPLGFTPSLSLTGDLDEQVPDDIAGTCWVRCGSRCPTRPGTRARAGSTSPSRSAVDLVLVVRDNGVGLREITRRSGLANLADRAEQLGGTLKVGQADGGGDRAALAGAAGLNRARPGPLGPPPRAQGPFRPPSRPGKAPGCTGCRGPSPAAAWPALRGDPAQAGTLTRRGCPPACAGACRFRAARSRTG